MPMHVYLSVNCKTQGCNTTIPIKHFGVDEGGVEIGEMTPLRVDCGCRRCGKSHWYEQAEFFVQKLPYGPPPGWKNGWEP